MCAHGGFIADESHTLDWLFEVPRDAGHTTRSVAGIITVRAGRDAIEQFWRSHHGDSSTSMKVIRSHGAKGESSL